MSKLQEYSPRQIHISIFTQCELFFGLEHIDNRKKLHKEQLEKAIQLFIKRINTLSPDEGFEKAYGIIRAGLVKKGQDIGVIDCMLAAQAITSNLALVTHNIKHYQRINTLSGIPKLKLIDWL